MQEPELERTHMARIEPVERAGKKTLTLALISLGGMAAGLGTAAAIEDHSSTGAAVAGISGLTIGLVGAIWALVAVPSVADQIEANTRSKLFLRGEDDMQAVARGVMRINSAQRQRCGGAAIAIPDRPLGRPRRTPPPRVVAPAEPSTQAEAPAASPSPTPAAPTECLPHLAADMAHLTGIPVDVRARSHLRMPIRSGRDHFRHGMSGSCYIELDDPADRDRRTDHQRGC